MKDIIAVLIVIVIGMVVYVQYNANKSVEGFFADFRIDFPTQYNYFLVTHIYFQNKISFF